jgi:hypothetical protein
MLEASVIAVTKIAPWFTTHEVCTTAAARSDATTLAYAHSLIRRALGWDVSLSYHALEAVREVRDPGLSS